MIENSESEESGSENELNEQEKTKLDPVKAENLKNGFHFGQAVGALLILFQSFTFTFSIRFTRILPIYPRQCFTQFCRVLILLIIEAWVMGLGLQMCWCEVLENINKG